MHLDIEGHHTSIAPHLLARIFDCLQDLNTPYTTTFEAHVTLAQHSRQRRKPYEVRIAVVGMGPPMQARQQGAGLDPTVETALEDIAQQLSARDGMGNAVPAP